MNILGKSSGPYNNLYGDITVQSEATLVRKDDGGVEVDRLEMEIDVGKIRWG